MQKKVMAIIFELSRPRTAIRDRVAKGFESSIYQSPYGPLCYVLIVLVVLLGSCLQAAALVGSDVAIRVIDATSSLPIPEAVVVYGDYNTVPEATLGKTDITGRFRGRIPKLERVDDVIGFEWHRPESIWLTRSGYVPKRVNLSQLSVNEETRRVSENDIRLEPGRHVHDRVLMENGTPVSGEPLLLIAGTEERPIQFETATDSEGRFEWSNAPCSKIFLAMGIYCDSPGVFQSLGNSDTEGTIRLGRDWRSMKTIAGARRLLCLRRSAGKLVFPLAIAQRQVIADFDNDLAIASSDRHAPQHAILSVAEDQKSFYFLPIYDRSDARRRLNFGQWTVVRENNR